MIWFIQNIAFSVSLIVIIHYLYLYFESTLTTPKVKDLIHCPKQKYNSLFETINSKLQDGGRNKNASYRGDSNNDSASTAATMTTAATAADHSGLGILPNRKNKGSEFGDGDDTSAMKNDLKSFLRTIGLKKQSTQPPRAQYEMN